MAIIKCKMCGGDLDIIEGKAVAECEYCGSIQTIPAVDDEKKVNLFNRANRLRTQGDYDRAAGVYETIVADFPNEAEAYWGLVLCKYGIAYVKDPATGNRIPTCNRSSFDNVLEDLNFRKALECCDITARRVYSEEAKYMENIRKGIIEVSNKEDPYDIFICYKETAEDGGRTLDSVMAQDIYDKLTEKGYRVFFSRITLESMLGSQYEPYIFAALNSAKVMLVFGTKVEYFQAVWVKNEWSRYLRIMAKDKTRHLIPCFRDINPYDMPEEFASFQAQDMGKVGADQDLLRGIAKFLPKEDPRMQQQQPTVISGGPNTLALMKRGYEALEFEEWDNAMEFFNQVLNMNAESAEAHVGQLLADLKLREEKQLGRLRNVEFWENRHYKMAVRYGDAAIKTRLEGYAESYRQAIRAAEQARQEALRKQQEEERLRREEEQRRKDAALRQMTERREKINKIRNVFLCIDHFKPMAMSIDGSVRVPHSPKDPRDKVIHWENIVAISGGLDHTAALREDGTVVATGDNKYGQCNVGQWRDIIAIDACDHYTAGLRRDGTVVLAGHDDTVKRNIDISGWQNIVALAVSESHVVGLKADGTVVASGENKHGECNVRGWTDIVSIDAGVYCTFGVRKDGTVVALGKNDNGQCNVQSWQNILVVETSTWHTLGIRADGTVVATGANDDGQCKVSQWKNIVAVSASYGKTMGIRADGTLVIAGDFHYNYKEEDVEEWKLFDSFDTLDAEFQAARTPGGIAARKAKQRAKIQSTVEFLQKSRKSLGVFDGKYKKEYDEKIAFWQDQLRRM